MSSRILVIKLGALGDIVQALGPFAAIRRHHADDEITLLTTLPFAEFLKRSPYFDQVWVDPRASWRRVDAVLALRRRLADGDFARVYDLQTSRRSGRYHLFWPQPRPEWSGIVSGCSHPDPDPNRDHIHTLDRQAGQLRGASIAAVPAPDLSWVVADVARFGLPWPYALLAPGAAAHRPEKRWPEAAFAALARDLLARGVTPALLGTAEERPILRAIVAAAPGTRDLAGETSLEELVGLGRDAALSVGNDTGPMHLLTVAGSPAIVLFSHASDPALCAPRGPRVEILRAPSLAELPVETVLQRVPSLLREPADAAQS